jgi:periplasmic divalent cation tolerance protein
MQQDGVQLVLMTAPDAETAERIVRTLVEERLIACGNIMVGVDSIYRWQGVVERGAEVLVMMKSTAARIPQLLERGAELHPYEVPELLVFPVGAGYAPYLAWVRECIASDDEREG